MSILIKRNIKNVRLPDIATDRAVREITTFLNKDAGIEAGRHIGDTVLENGTVTKIAHGLGRKLRGWIVTDLRGAAAAGYIERVLDDGGKTPDDERDLWLKANSFGADITVRLYVY